MCFKLCLVGRIENVEGWKSGGTKVDLDFSHICLVDMMKMLRNGFFFCWEEKWKGKKNNSYKFTSIPLFDKKINNKLKKKKKPEIWTCVEGRKGTWIIYHPNPSPLPNFSPIQRDMILVGLKKKHSIQLFFSLIFPS